MKTSPRATTILIVDDQADIRMMCRVNLRLQGYEVLEAEDGDAGLAVVLDHEPDLVLLDIMMPGADGWQMLDRLKGMPATEALPVVLLTARVQREDEIRGWIAGAAAYLAKPFNPSALSDVVARVLSGRTPEADRRRNAIQKLHIH